MNIIEFDSVLKYIQDMKTLYPVVEDRITLLNLKTPDSSIPGSAEPHSVVSVSIIFFASIAPLLFYN